MKLKRSKRLLKGEIIEYFFLSQKYKKKYEWEREEGKRHILEDSLREGY